MIINPASNLRWNESSGLLPGIHGTRRTILTVPIHGTESSELLLYPFATVSLSLAKDAQTLARFFRISSHLV
jgi:hypothetical protein